MQKSRYQKIIIALAIIVGVCVAILLSISDITQMIVNNPTTEEDYVQLEEKAIQHIKNYTGNILEDEYFTLDENDLTYSVSSEKARVTVRIPTLSQYLELKDGTAVYNAMLDFENMEYIRENKLRPAGYHIFMIFACSGLAMIVFYIAFYDFWTSFRKKQ